MKFFIDQNSLIILIKFGTLYKNINFFLLCLILSRLLTKRHEHEETLYQYHALKTLVLCFT